MKQLLAPPVGDASPVMVIGFCKNAGETTAMRRPMAGLGEECLGLISVDRNGEYAGLVTGAEKPDLYPKKGDLLATARGMFTLCDAALEVVDLTDVMTPLGPVAVSHTLSNGYVQLAGPSVAGQLPPLTRRFQELGAQWVLIDGVAGRENLAGTGVERMTLLYTGASLDRDIELVVAETAHTYRLFARKRPRSTALCATLDGQGAHFTLFTPEGEPAELPLEESGAPKWNKSPRRPLALQTTGGIMDPLLKTLVRRGAPTALVVMDATHVLAGRAALDLFLHNGGELRVCRGLTIAIVGINPWLTYD